MLEVTKGQGERFIKVRLPPHSVLSCIFCSCSWYSNSFNFLVSRCLRHPLVTQRETYSLSTSSSPILVSTWSNIQNYPTDFLLMHSYPTMNLTTFQCVYALITLSVLVPMTVYFHISCPSSSALISKSSILYAPIAGSSFGLLRGMRL